MSVCTFSDIIVERSNMYAFNNGKQIFFCKHLTLLLR